MNHIVVRRPDDFHLHVRQEAMLLRVLPSTTKVFARALIMPNTNPPIKTDVDALRYKQDIQNCIPLKHSFEPLMTIKLGDWTTRDDIIKAKRAGVIAGKLYPEGVTTNSEDGVKHIASLYDVFSAMQDCDMVLCLHGEKPDAFCLDREVEFLKDVMFLVDCFPKLRIVLEHITTTAAANYVMSAPQNVVATITVHHLMITLDDVIGGMLKPHLFCKPIAKRPQDRETLRRMLAGNPKFFLGTDSAPHAPEKKVCESGCAGIFSASVAMPLLAQIFEEEGILDKLQSFTSVNGALFYGLPFNDGEISLIKREWIVPDEVGGIVVPFMAGQILAWDVEPNDT
jgi:dihydroorotase